MTDHLAHRSETRVVLGNPVAMLGNLLPFFDARGTVIRRPDGARVETSFGIADLLVETDALRLEARAADARGLYVMKMVLAEHIFLHKGEEAIAFAWSGDSPDPRPAPFFREMEVRRVCNVTPLMRRVTLAGEDIAHFAGGGLHIRLLFAPAGRVPVWPRIGADGRMIWPEGEDALLRRVYTIRSVDLARGEADVDMVLHEDPGAPGSTWAAQAQPGDRVGVLGPGGSRPDEADWYLLAGDETALPMIARIAESLPETARAVLLIEVADAAEQQPITSAASLDIRWLHRSGAEPGSTRLIEDAVREVVFPDEGSRAIYVGCEQEASRRIRTLLHEEMDVPKGGSHVSAYWRRAHHDESAGPSA